MYNSNEITLHNFYQPFFCNCFISFFAGGFVLPLTPVVPVYFLCALHLAELYMGRFTLPIPIPQSKPV